MFSKIIEPRFGDTDALGHINNISIAKWFELARNDLHRLLNPSMDPHEWNLIMAHSSYDFHAETHYGSDVEVRTFVEKIGNSSFTLRHEVWQKEQKTVTGKTVIVHFDFNDRRPILLTDSIIEKLKEHVDGV